MLAGLHSFPRNPLGRICFLCFFQHLEAPFSVFQVSSAASSNLSLSLTPENKPKEPFHWWARGRVV